VRIYTASGYGNPEPVKLKAGGASGQTSVIRYTDTLGQSQAKNLGLLLQHFFNHQTHHRGQATALLFQAGVDMGVTDLAALIPSQR
jgi:uncharacterized damage-inducible protein DinB